jgi:S-layer homology domain
VLYRNRSAVILSLTVLLTSLTACANSPTAKNFEQSLAADPRLQNNPAILGGSVNPTQTPQTQPTPQATVQLPADFPKDIPQYPGIQLQEITPLQQGQVSTRWQSVDPSNFIASFYRSQFQSQNWQILQQPTDDTGGIFEAKRNNLLVRVNIQPKSVTNAAPNQPQTLTELKIDYSPNGIAFAPSENAIAQTPTPQATATTSSPTSESTAQVDIPQPGNPEFIGPVAPGTNITATPTNPPINAPTTSASQQYSDTSKAPAEVQRYIQDLSALGVLTISPSQTKANSNATTQFEPSKIITRREYARWLVAANNAMYANNPAKQIRAAAETTQPAFSDVSKTHPDFSVIQGLAEAGLIPSPLSGDATEVLFRPDAPLAREQLILWKLPLDTRQALPTASLEAVKQTWGFQDIGKIDPKALRAVLADYQNGEQSNIRRVFGYTTLFQPKKPVNRAEAAAALWYFGTQGDGISAADALKLKR